MEFFFPLRTISTNALYGVANGRVFPTTEAKKFKKDVLVELDKQNYKPTLHKYKGAVRLHIYVFHKTKRSFDIDNQLKCLIDSLKDILFEDDKYVFEIWAVKREDAPDDRVGVKVEPITDVGICTCGECMECRTANFKFISDTEFTKSLFEKHNTEEGSDEDDVIDLTVINK
jgi:Holliday junction resolvase RusA-like endonuclease